MLFENISEIIEALPPQIIDNLSGLITILKAVGIAFIIYVVYIVIKLILNFKNTKRIRVMEKKIDSIERKINKLLKKKKK